MIPIHKYRKIQLIKSPNYGILILTIKGNNIYSGILTYIYIYISQCCGSLRVYCYSISVNINYLLLAFSCLLDVDVTIVVSLKIILLQCVGGQLDQGLYVMHAALCGLTRLVIVLISLVVMKCLV